MVKPDLVQAPSFAALVQAFFAEHLQQQRAMSPRTVAAYRDAFVLFLDFAQARLRKQPTAIRLEEITPALILAFLDHLERERGNTVRSRNARLAALRAFLKFAGRRDVSALHAVEQALGVPMKRFERPMLGFLSREEMLAIIGKPDESWTSQRDHLLLRMLYNTGARVSEIIGVTLADVVLDGAACVHLHGKGRKQRTVPLWRSTVRQIRAWLRFNPQLQATSAPEVIVVVAFGQFLPRAIRELPPLGCINVHASLLPKYRGAAPIHRAVMAGDDKTGVTIMRVEGRMDAGPILLQRTCPILPEDDTGILHDRLAALGAEALSDALRILSAGERCMDSPGRNPGQRGPEARRRRLSPGVGGTTRGPGESDPRPVADARRLSRDAGWQAAPDLQGRGAPGERPAGRDPRRRGRPRSWLGTGEGAVALLEVQPEGKRRMTGAEFAGDSDSRRECAVARATSARPGDRSPDPRRTARSSPAEEPAGARRIALDVLLRVEATDAYANILLDARLRAGRLDRADRRLGHRTGVRRPALAAAAPRFPIMWTLPANPGSSSFNIAFTGGKASPASPAAPPSSAS